MAPVSVTARSHWSSFLHLDCINPTYKGLYTFWFQGRQTEHVLAAAVYIAWVAEEPTVRLKTKLQTFFKRNSTNCSNIRVTRQRYVELVQVICKLAKVNRYHE